MPVVNYNIGKGGGNKGVEVAKQIIVWLTRYSFLNSLATHRGAVRDMPDNNPSIEIVSDLKFKDALKAGDPPTGLGLRKGWTCDEVRTIDTEKRIIDFIISTDAVDRMFDTVAVDGWELTAFKKNPVVLFAHDHAQPPIAKAKSVKVDEIKKGKKALVSRAEFMSEEISPFAFSIFRMFVEGFMKATSVGFVPLEFKFAEGEDRPFGIDFIKQELIEFSAVPVPANPEALVDARSKGINTIPLRDWAAQTLDEYELHERSGLVMAKKTIEQLRKHADPTGRKVFNITKADQRRLAKENLERMLREKQAEESEMSEQEHPQVIMSWDTAHPKGTECAPVTQGWEQGEGGRQLSVATEDTKSEMCLWKDENGPALIHHTAEGQVVLQAVAQIAATALPLMELDGSLDKEQLDAAKEHLTNHYHQFDLEAPWAEEAAWTEYLDAIKGAEGDDIKRCFDKLFGTVLSDAACLSVLGVEVRGEEVEEPSEEVDETTEGGDDDEGVDMNTSANGKSVDEPAEEVETVDVEDEEERAFDPVCVTEALIEDIDRVLEAITNEVMDLDALKANRPQRRLLRSLRDNTAELSQVLNSALDEEKDVADRVASADTIDIDFDESDSDDVGDENNGYEELLMDVLQQDLPALVEEELKKHINKMRGKVD